MEVGFIGLGMMGEAMARNIVKAGHRVRAWNRSPRPDTDGFEIVATPGDAFQADVVFTMLSDDAAIREVVLSSGALRRARKGAVHVVASTISIDLAEELRMRHAEAGLGYVSAPVFGRPDVAAAARLNIVAAGEKSVIDKVQPLFDVIGGKTWLMGEDPKLANAAKLAGNMMIAMAVESMAEAVALSDGYGVPPKTFLDLMLQTLFAGRVYESYGPKMVSGDFTPGFKLQLALKDVRLAAEAAEKSGKRLPQLDAVRARMSDAVAAGLGDKDLSAMAEYARSRRR